MFCRKCGYNLDDGDMFCPSCGNKVIPLQAYEPDKTVVISEDSAVQSGNAYKGLLFDEREPSYNNAIKIQQTDEQAKQAEIQTEFASPEAAAPQETAATEIAEALNQPSESAAPPTPDFSQLKSPLFSGNDDLIPDLPVAPPSPDFGEEKETQFAEPEPEAEFSAAEQETEFSAAEAEQATQFAETEQATEFSAVEQSNPFEQKEPADEPYVMPDLSGLIGEATYIAYSNKPPKAMSAELETEIAAAREQAEAQTVFASAQEQAEAVTEIASADDNIATEFAEKTDNVAPMDDSYNVYSGAVPGVTSQEFRYPTNDNAYPDLPTSIAPQFDEDATIVGVDYTQPAFANRTEANQQGNIAPGGDSTQLAVENQSYNQQNIPPYIPQNAYAEAVAPTAPKKKNTAMWIIIACVAVIIIAIGGTCAFILTQYDSFEDFFASFSDSDEEDDDDEDRDEDKEKDDKPDSTTKADKDKIKPVSTTSEITTQPLATTVSTTEAPKFDGYCGAQVHYTYDASSMVLTIAGTGEMQNYANTVNPWAGKTVKRVVIDEGVTSVSPGAFTEINPESIYISSTVSSFDVLAVNKFGGIEVSPLNNSYKSVNGVLFDKSGTILVVYPNQKVSTSYAIPEGVKIIHDHAFYEATNLKTLSISSTVEYIDDYAFMGSTNIHRLDVPANVTEIRKGVFYGWLESQEIYIANAKTKVVEDWNEGCSAKITVLT